MKSPAVYQFQVGWRQRRAVQTIQRVKSGRSSDGKCSGTAQAGADGDRRADVHFYSAVRTLFHQGAVEVQEGQ